ncbi:hypothetical protein H8L32_16575 [Undibacterium sp. CY18W]|uniref:Uncharacterized protein n=1 Tax=Undibacterium hunanense TaxID=2762292 RepID=A0ABR6ZTA4_9BURK|nr:hypothetical protein [Undibacterium hunanense]MBC3919108.1 hypothetical protein [Undibacterium hunanense]
MSDPPKKIKKILRKVTKIVLSVILILMIFPAAVLYANWSAENEAKAFCDAVDTGSNISLAIIKFETKIGEKETLHYEFNDGRGHRFLFSGFMFDKAQCTVQSDREGKVLSKVSEMLYD